MKILEIPPYRKNQLKNNAFAAANPSASTSRIPEIPAFNRKSSEQSTLLLDSSQQGQVTEPEWMRRLKSNNSSGIHRSVDCISANKEIVAALQPEPVKATPSWINLTEKVEAVSSTSLPNRKSPLDDDNKGKSTKPQLFTLK